VDNLQSLYSYNLYSYYLNHSLRSFTQATNKIVSNSTQDITLKNDSFIFSIDPLHCRDFDDAISIQKFKNNKYCLSVYITEIVSDIDENNLWNFFTERVSSIYLPQTKLCMIPQSFTESCLSLQESKTRRVLKVDFFFNEDGTQDHISTSNDITFVNITIIDAYIDKNFVYEEESLLNNSSYKTLYNLTKLIETTIQNSHDVVTFWMIKTNEYCANFMKMNQQGIFRKVTSNDNLKHDLNNWNHLSSQYVLCGNENSPEKPYAQVTSPIRRIVDLLNQIILCNLVSVTFSNKADEFLNKWLSKIDEINAGTKKIRKLQFECSLLSYFNEREGETKKRYRGVVVEKKECVSGLKNYVIYVSELKLFTKVSKCEEDAELEQIINIEFYIFYHHVDLCKKIMCVIV
jgi:RNB domain